MSLTLVAGGAGEVGTGIVRALLHDGHQVIVPSRSADKLDRLAAHVGASAARLLPVHADLHSDTGMRTIRQAVRAAGPLHSVISSLGGFRADGPVLELSVPAILSAQYAGVFAHWRIAQAFWSLLRGPTTSLVQINGAAALLGIPGAGALNISAAAQLALTRSLIAEAPEDGPQVASFVVMQQVATHSHPLGDDALSADDIGRTVSNWITLPHTHTIAQLSKVAGDVVLTSLPGSPS